MKTTLILLLLAVTFTLASAQDVIRDSNDPAVIADTLARTPDMDGISFLKIAKNGKESICLCVTLSVTIPGSPKTGLSILLDNGEMINKPEAVVDINQEKSGKYVYRTVVELEAKEIEQLRTQQVTNFKLYVYYNSVKQGSRIKESLSSLAISK